MTKWFLGAALAAMSMVAIAGDKVFDEKESREKVLNVAIDKGFTDPGTNGAGVGSFVVNGEAAFGTDLRIAVTESADIKTHIVTNGDDYVVGASVILSW